MTRPFATERAAVTGWELTTTLTANGPQRRNLLILDAVSLVTRGQWLLRKDGMADAKSTSLSETVRSRALRMGIHGVYGLQRILIMIALNYGKSQQMEDAVRRILSRLVQSHYVLPQIRSPLVTEYRAVTGLRRRMPRIVTMTPGRPPITVAV